MAPEKQKMLKLKPKTDAIERAEAKRKKKAAALEFAQKRVESKMNPQQEAKQKLFDTTQDGQTFQLF